MKEERGLQSVFLWKLSYDQNLSYSGKWEGKEYSRDREYLCKKRKVGVGQWDRKLLNQVINHTKVNVLHSELNGESLKNTEVLQSNVWFRKFIEEGRMERIRIVTRLLP